MFLLNMSAVTHCMRDEMVNVLPQYCVKLQSLIAFEYNEGEGGIAKIWHW